MLQEEYKMQKTKLTVQNKIEYNGQQIVKILIRIWEIVFVYCWSG